MTGRSLATDLSLPAFTAPAVATSTTSPLEATGTSSLSAPVSAARVLHVINGEHYAGAEKVQDLLGLQLPLCGFDVTYACLKPDRFAEMRQAQTATLINAPMRSRFDLRPARQLAQLIRDDDYQIIHTHTPRAALIGQLAARKAGVPLVHHVHGQTLVEVGRRGISWVSAKVERLSLRSAHRLIAVSESSAEYLRAQGFNTERIGVVPNGVPVPHAQRSATPPRESWTIGTVAMFRPRKGTEVLLDAIAELRDQGYPVRLRAIGGFETPEYEAHVRHHAERLGIQNVVDWIGFRQDVSAEMSQLDVMVLPSLLAEGLPMVVIEAMASGVPVVGTRVPGTTDVIQHDVDGLLASPSDATSLAEQLARLMRGDVDWSVLHSNGQIRHAEAYSVQSMARGVADIYQQVLCEREN